MGLITTEIQPQGFERVRDQIGAILATEIEGQEYITGDDLFDLTVWNERFIPFAHNELPAVNVTLARGEFDGQDPKQHNGTYRYFIECYTSAKSGTGVRGDAKATIKLHKLLGVCRSIIMDPRYITLGFARPFVMNRHFESIVIADPGKQDAASVMMGRLVLSVKVPETTDLIEPAMIEEYHTSVKLHETELGYLYIGINDVGFNYDFDIEINS